MSARVHALTPQDELIGSLTQERIALAVRYAGGQALEGTEEAKHWLAYALGTDVPLPFYTLATAVERREQLEDCDLEFWYDIANTEANRAAMQAKADYSIDYCVRQLAAILCTQLGVTA
jgi:hypothetical protein